MDSILDNTATKGGYAPVSRGRERGGDRVEERQQVSFTREIQFCKGQNISVTVSLSGQEKKDYGKMLPVVKVLFEEIVTTLENQS